MRLDTNQIAFIRETVAGMLGASARIYVFGSRLQDDARGGDLDLLLESETKLSFLQRACIKLTLESHLGIPVDIISTQQGAARTAFQAIAHMQGVLL
ncbi:MAG: nucleotidyltransferase domain-containing protein [Ferrovum myxofaciens]|uniref:nucleotidyltransferase domain-containing protein n=1 Tax=Ferrovum myxofaciens TaxID=416213 RepID=UPI00235588E8|nr:nucleotidyltransferase domain-containing protein [Ferrovum myxofaciens]QKE41850.1 MAG: nucleotidyltransferase domain-containing protein [Ferrovum myxofaciens]